MFGVRSCNHTFLFSASLKGRRTGAWLTAPEHVKRSGHGMVALCPIRCVIARPDPASFFLAAVPAEKNSLLFPGQGALDAFAGFGRERGCGGSVLAFQSLGVLADSFPDEEELLPIPLAVLAHQEM